MQQNRQVNEKLVLECNKKGLKSAKFYKKKLWYMFRASVSHVPDMNERGTQGYAPYQIDERDKEFVPSSIHRREEQYEDKRDERDQGFNMMNKRKQGYDTSSTPCRRDKR
jgi:hypothetical protein